VRRLPEDVLHVGAHVDLLEHLVALVQHEVPNAAHLQRTFLCERLDAPGRADHHDRVLLAQLLAVLLDVDAPEKVGHLDRGHELGEALKLVADLVGQLARVAKHHRFHLGRLVALL